MHDLYGDEMYHHERCNDLLREAEHERRISRAGKVRADRDGVRMIRISIETGTEKENNRQIIWEVL